MIAVVNEVHLEGHRHPTAWEPQDEHVPAAQSFQALQARSQSTSGVHPIGEH